MAALFNSNKKSSDKDKNKKLVPLSKPVYTTRQIMELEERRRKELALSEQAVAPVTPSNPQPVETPAANIENRVPEHPEKIKTPLPDGKTVAQLFREEPVSPKEKEISSLIEHLWNQALEEVKPDLSPVQEEVVPVEVETKVKRFTDDIIGQPAQQKKVFNPSEVAKEVSSLDWLGIVFSLSAGAMFFVMFSYLFSIGFNEDQYMQGPFALMIALSVAWLNRNRLKLRREGFWGSLSIVTGGLGIFALALNHGSVHLALTGFMFTAFGLFLWRYTEESACHLMFPLSYLVFMFSPPDIWTQTISPILNSFALQGAYFLLGSFHVPGGVQGSTLNIDGYQFQMENDLTAFRSLVALAGLGALYAYFQKTVLIGKAVILCSVIPLVILSNIVSVALSGWIVTNYGLESGQTFLSEYSVLSIFLLTLLGFFIVSFLVRGEEDL